MHMHYIATDPDETAIYAIGESADDAIRTAKRESYGTARAYDFEARERGLSGFVAHPATPELADHVAEWGGDTVWDYLEDGTACLMGQRLAD